MTEAVGTTTASARAWRKLRRDPLTIGGAAVIVLVMAVSLAAPLLAPYDPTVIDVSNRLRPPSAEHLLGTDELGRDAFSRLLYGGRISLLVGIIVVALRAVIGVTIGVVAGYFGGSVDAFLMRIVDVFLTFPGILLALGIMAIWGPGLDRVIIALSVTGWAQFARLVRAETLALRERDYVASATALGASSVRVMAIHVLPNLLPIIVVYSAVNVSIPIVAEAALSFLGLGIQPPDFSWGSMLSGAHAYMRTAWWLALFPGLAITFTVIGFNLLGDGVRDALDPRVG